MDFKTYLGNLPQWDKVNRLQDALTKYLGVKKTDYTREVLAKIMIAAVARNLSDCPVRFDNMLVLVGEAGIGKTKFIKSLCAEEQWYTQLEDFNPEYLSGRVIVEITEGLDSSKDFISKSYDAYRELYQNRITDHKRNCVFIASTNEIPSGEFRRFWPVECADTKWCLDPEREYFTQMWAEARFRYLEGEGLELSEEAMIALVGSNR